MEVFNTYETTEHLFLQKFRIKGFHDGMLRTEISFLGNDTVVPGWFSNILENYLHFQ
jgi:hypothetical protein